MVTTHAPLPLIKSDLPILPPDHSTSVGGRISQFLPVWNNITTDRWVLQIIQYGYCLELTSTPPNIPPKHKMSPEHITLKTRGSIPVTKTCNRARSQVSTGHRSIFPVLLNSKEGRHSETYSGSQTTQPLHTVRPLSRGHTATSNAAATQRRLPCYSRPQGRLLSHSHTSCIQEIPPICSGRTTFPVQSATIRGNHSSQSVHQMLSSGSSTSLQTTHSCVSIPGRVANKSQLTTAVPSTHSSNHSVATRTRIHHQPCKIPSSALSYSSISRGYSKHNKRNSSSKSSQDSSYSIPYSKVPATTLPPCKSVHATDRDGGILHIHCTSRKTTNAPFTRMSSTSVEPGPGSVDRPGVGRQPHTSLSAVVEYNKPFQRAAVPGPGSTDSVNYRCIPLRLGSSSSTAHSTGQVDTTTKVATYQPPGAIGNFSSSQVLSTSNTKQSCPHQNRQHDSYVLHTKTRRNTHSTAVQTSAEHLEVGYSQKHLSAHRASTRRTQSNCGSVKSSYATDSRMGTSSSSYSSVFSEVGLSRHRSLRHTKQRQMPKLRLQVPTSTVSRECDMDELVRQICLHLSASPTHPPSDMQTAATLTEAHPSCANLGQTTMVHHSTATVSGTTPKTHTLPTPVNTEPWRDHAPRSSSAQFSNLAPDVLEFGYLNLPPDCMHIITEA